MQGENPESNLRIGASTVVLDQAGEHLEVLL